MSKAATFANDWLKLLFNGTPIANIADNAAVAPLSNLYLSLHTSDPGTTDSQTTNEIAYTGYARVAIQRTGAGWVVTGASVSPAANVVFPEMTGGAGGTVTHVGLGTSASGTGKMLVAGALTPNIPVAVGVAVVLPSTSTISEV